MGHSSKNLVEGWINIQPFGHEQVRLSYPLRELQVDNNNQLVPNVRNFLTREMNNGKSASRLESVNQPG
jgi:hypothetical protein